MVESLSANEMLKIFITDICEGVVKKLLKKVHIDICTWKWLQTEGTQKFGVNGKGGQNRLFGYFGTHKSVLRPWTYHASWAGTNVVIFTVI